MTAGGDLVRAVLGRTGREVTRVGLGGEGVLRTFGHEEEAYSVILEAYSGGILYFDSAHAYAGSEEYYGRFWRAHPGWRDNIFQASKSAGRTAEEAQRDLARTLMLIGTDHLDLWQIHDLRTRDDLRRIEGPGGAMEAFIEAKETGLVRHIGVTGHHDPAILTHAVTRWPVDTVLLPVNPVEAVLGGFLDKTIPEAHERGIGVIGMKVLGAGSFLFPKEGVIAGRLISFALGQGADMVVVGCGSPSEVRTLVRHGLEKRGMVEEEQEELISFFRPVARKLAYYRGVL